ncbi:MAG: hypothetical protein ABIA75_07055 [Candidatus Neomarinimicrobiota bacterium]
MIIKIRHLIYSLILLGGLFAQVRVGQWDSFTSPLNIRAMTELGDTILAATDGGLLIFERTGKQFSVCTNIQGLTATSLNALCVDPYSQVWLGGAAPLGVIEIYDLAHSASLVSFDYNLSEITAFACSDSIVFGAFRQNQDWGLIEFIYRDGQYKYRDVYRNWPVALGRISGVAIVGNSVLVATDAGLWSNNWRLNNLKDPASWERPFPELTGNIRSFHQYGEQLLLLNEKIVYLLNFTDSTISWVWDYFANSYQFLDVIRTADGACWGILAKTFIKLSDDAKEWQFSDDYNYSNLLPLADGGVAVGTPAGIALLDQSGDQPQLLRYIPNAPLTNEFTAITLLTDGRVVAGSRYGLAIREPDGWRNIVEYSNTTAISLQRDYNYFCADTIPVDFGAFITDLEQGPDGLVYCGIRGTYPYPRRYGGGIVIIDIDDPANYTLIDTAVLDYFKDEYMVVKDLEFDAVGNLWVADTYSTTRRQTLHVRDSQGDWGHFQATAANPLAGAPGSVTIDRWQRVWIGSEQWSENPADMTNGGLAMLQYSGDPVNPDAISWTAVKSAVSVWSTIVTPQDLLYILTPQGLTGLYLQNSGNQPVARETVTYFPNISFGVGAEVRLDARNNVWALSPSQGIHVLLENGTYWPDPDGFRFANSDLLADEVTDLVFDDRSGLAYIATGRGINSLRVPFAASRKSYSGLKVFPSPYHVPGDTPLAIAGLKDGSAVKIMKIDGQVIRAIDFNDAEIHGDQAFWDGRDKDGKLVVSGVYLIAVYSSTDAAAFTKITVIRE